jgi:hypothetical protein
VLWGDVLVDGHNRYGICQKHGIAFQTLQSTHFKTMDDVHLWMIDQHLGRRSVSDYQRGVLAIRQREILNTRRLEAAEPAKDTISRQDLAKAARLSSSQVVLIEKIQKQATPELVAAVKSGAISINAAAAVSSLPEQEQVAATLGGKEQLLQAAKRVRDTRKKTGTEETNATVPETIDALKMRIAELENENSQLRAQLAALRD